jgi:hypothetical protein
MGRVLRYIQSSMTLLRFLHVNQLRLIDSPCLALARSARLYRSNSFRTPPSVCVFCSSNESADADNLALAAACGTNIASRGMTLVSGLTQKHSFKLVT